MTHSTSASVAASGSLPATPLMHAAVSHESAAPALALHEESPRQPVAAEEHFWSAHCAGVPSCISCSNAEVTQPCAMTHSTSASVAASGSLPATPLMHAAVSHESAAPALALHEESP